MSPFVVTMPLSLAVPPLLSALVTGKTLGTVEIQLATTDAPTELNYLTITLSNARVSSLTESAPGESSAGDRPVESVSFVAARYKVSYIAQKPDGGPGKTEAFCFNFALQRAC
jgi:type VI protein secretion system component Hcp